MKKKKIAVIGLKGLPAFGGAATVGENIIEQLKDKYDFTVYSTSSHTNLTTGNYNGYKQIVFNNLGKGGLNTFVYYIKSALHSVFKGKYDLIHVNHIASGFIIPFLKLKYAVVGSVHGNPEKVDKWIFLGKFIFPPAKRLFLRFSDLIITVSKVDQEQYQKKTRKRVVHIPNGVNMETCSSKGSKNKSYLLFAAARIVEIKGCHTFLEALHRIGYDERILIIGDLIQRKSYERKIQSLALGLDVSFTGLIRDKKLLMSYFRDAKLFVFPSFVEAMSMILLEVASTGVPIICSDIQENMAVFQESEVTFFRVGDPKDLGDKILWAIRNMEEVESRAKRAYQKLANQYLWKDISERYASLYLAIIGQLS